jgi:hypothetical protein
MDKGQEYLKLKKDDFWHFCQLSLKEFYKEKSLFSNIVAHRGKSEGEFMLLFK